MVQWHWKSGVGGVHLVRAQQSGALEVALREGGTRRKLIRSAAST